MDISTKNVSSLDGSPLVVPLVYMYIFKCALNTEIILGLLENEWFNVEQDPHDPVNQHEDHGDAGVCPRVKVSQLTSRIPTTQ